MVVKRDGQPACGRLPGSRLIQAAPVPPGSPGCVAAGCRQAAGVFFRFPVGTVLGVPERAAGDGVEDVGSLALDGDADRIAGADHSLGR
jgi:hypothetical protein